MKSIRNHVLLSWIETSHENASAMEKKWEIMGGNFIKENEVSNG